MRFLTYSECAAWCEQRHYPTVGSVVGPEAHQYPEGFTFAKFSLPVDSGAKVAFARFLYSQLNPAPELLLWISDWGVWPSSQHMPLFTRFREAFKESRPLIKLPGHLVLPDNSEDTISILIVSLCFFWSCHVITASGRDAIFVSHDEHGWFASREPKVVELVQKRMSEGFPQLLGSAEKDKPIKN